MFELQAPPPAPDVWVLPEIAGVRWPHGVKREKLQGEVSMFDLEDEGKLQEW